MATIQIITVTNDFPEWVKQALIGLEFPVEIVPKEAKHPFRQFNFWGPPTVQSTSPPAAYYLTKEEFLRVLGEKNPEAVEWFKDKTLIGLVSWIGFAQGGFSLLE